MCFVTQKNYIKNFYCITHYISNKYIFSKFFLKKSMG